MFIGFDAGCTLRLMNPINIGPGGEFLLGGENFLIEGDVAVKKSDVLQRRGW